jgi:hypothetical protein
LAEFGLGVKGSSLIWQKKVAPSNLFVSRVDPGVVEILCGVSPKVVETSAGIVRSGFCMLLIFILIVTPVIRVVMLIVSLVAGLLAIVEVVASLVLV